VGRATLLFGSLRDDAAGRCVLGHSERCSRDLVETGKRLDRCSAGDGDGGKSCSWEAEEGHV
jgi:hypothetical protein